MLHLCRPSSSLLTIRGCVAYAVSGRHAICCECLLTLHHARVQSTSNLLNRYRGSDTNLYQRNLEAQALMAQQQALGMGIQGLSSQSALDLLQVSLYDPSTCNECVRQRHTSELC